MIASSVIEVGVVVARIVRMASLIFIPPGGMIGPTIIHSAVFLLGRAFALGVLAGSRSCRIVLVVLNGVPLVIGTAAFVSGGGIESRRSRLSSAARAPV